MINAELKRMERLLNDMLDQSSHSPEVPTIFDVRTLVRDLVALTRYQIAESICLEIDVPFPLPVHLPESGIRQALLNLILNAADARLCRKYSEDCNPHLSAGKIILPKP